MIYHFTIKKNTKRGQKMDKDFWLTADSEKDLYKRASHQYCVPIEDIEITETKQDKEVKI